MSSSEVPHVVARVHRAVVFHVRRDDRHRYGLATSACFCT